MPVRQAPPYEKSRTVMGYDCRDVLEMSTSDMTGRCNASTPLPFLNRTATHFPFLLQGSRLYFKQPSTCGWRANVLTRTDIVLQLQLMASSSHRSL